MKYSTRVFILVYFFLVVPKLLFFLSHYERPSLVIPKLIWDPLLKGVKPNAPWISDQAREECEERQ